jgi:hypothetical protein
MACAYQLKIINKLQNKDKTIPELMAFIAEICGGNIINSKLRTSLPLSDREIENICNRAQIELGCYIELCCV